MSRVLLTLTVATALSACRGSDKSATVDTGTTADGTDGTDGTTEPVDADGDGVSEEEDCDDADADAWPGATEVCDGVDNDCDGDIDEGVLSTSYADADGDGFGDPDDALEACAPPAGRVTNADDCDDDDPRSSPLGVEVCDGVDNDCDGDIDEEAVDAPLWYADTDADGFGTGDAIAACGAPSGTARVDGDCDDADGGIHPDANELCDGADNDCDGQADEADAIDTSSWYADSDGDGFGSTVGVSACEAPSGFVDNNTDCDDGDAASNPGASETCDEADNDCDGDTDEGVQSTYYADTDSDGRGDASSSTEACAAPSGYVTTSDDCDDSDGAISPLATEVCDGADNDCDGDIDEAGAVGLDTWYADTDGDGYGDPSSAAAACAAPTGYVADDTDCDDAEAAVNPGGTEVADGLDNDCDGAGLDGTYAPASDEDLAGGTWEFTDLTIASGVTVTVTGSDPLEVYVLGTADISGSLLADGQDGDGLGPFLSSGRYAGGDGGGGGGGAGGWGASYYQDGYPNGLGAAGDGASPGQPGVGYSAGGGGGGGGQVDDGGDGENAGGCYSAVAGGAGGASVNSSSSPSLVPGSGGGGGGYGTGYNSDGAGGGGGGGALYVWAPTLSVSGTIGCAGGDGGSNDTGTNYHAAGAGGGSGGTLWLVADTLTVSGTLDCSGGLGGTPDYGSHCGTAGAGGDGAAGLVYLDATSSSLTGSITPTEATP